MLQCSEAEEKKNVPPTNCLYEGGETHDLSVKVYTLSTVYLSSTVFSLHTDFHLYKIQATISFEMYI